jgi:hypothetical protein
MLGGAFLLSAAQSAFNNTMIRHATSVVAGIDPALLIGTGATEIRHVFSAAQIPGIIAAYMAGIKVVFAITIGATGFACLFSLLGRWKRLHAEDMKNAGGAA